MEEFLQAWVGVRNLEGKRTVVRNGYNPERTIQTGIGEVSVRMPKVRDSSQNGVVFHSSLIPPYIRKARSLEELIPLLYLKGVSTGQMQEALGALVGRDAQGFSPALVSRLKAKWTKGYGEFRKRPIEGEWLYLWVDGIYSKMRKESDKLCLLVVMGANSWGEKKILAIEDGFRKSAESWKEVLRNLKERGLTDPLLVIGDGALGFWAAVRESGTPRTGKRRRGRFRAL